MRAPKVGQPSRTTSISTVEEPLVEVRATSVPAVEEEEVLGPLWHSSSELILNENPERCAKRCFTGEVILS